MASEQNAVPPLASVALRGLALHDAELDSGSRRSLLPGLGADLPGLRSDLPGLRPNQPGSKTPLSSPHVPRRRGQTGLLPRRQHGRRLEINLSGHNAEVQQDAVAPDSTTAVHKSPPVLAPRAARSNPVVARPAGLGHSRARAATSAREIAEQDFSSGLRGPQDGQDFGGGPGAEGLPDTFAPHSTPQDHSGYGPVPCAKRPFGYPACWTWTLSGSDCGVSDLSYQARFFLGLGKLSRWAALGRYYSGLDAGGLLDDADRPSAAASTSD